MSPFNWAARPLHSSWVWPVGGTGRRLERQERRWGIYSAASCLHPSAQLSPHAAPSGSGAMTVSDCSLSLVPTLFPQPCLYLCKESFYLKVFPKIPPKCTVFCKYQAIHRHTPTFSEWLFTCIYLYCISDLQCTAMCTFLDRIHKALFYICHTLH